MGAASFVSAEELQPGTVVTCDANLPLHSYLQDLPAAARGEVLLVAEHQQVMIIEGGPYHDLQPTLVITRNDAGIFVTSERDREGHRKPLARTTPLPADLLGRLEESVALAQSEARVPAIAQVGWQVQTASGTCVHVIYDMFSHVFGNPPPHWVVAVVHGLVDFAEARSKRQKSKAEAAIRAALPATL